MARWQGGKVQVGEAGSEVKVGLCEGELYELSEDLIVLPKSTRQSRRSRGLSHNSL